MKRNPKPWTEKELALLAPFRNSLPPADHGQLRVLVGVEEERPPGEPRGQERREAEREARLSFRGWQTEAG